MAICSGSMPQGASAERWCVLYEAKDAPPPAAADGTSCCASFVACTRLAATPAGCGCQGSTGHGGLPRKGDRLRLQGWPCTQVGTEHSSWGKVAPGRSASTDGEYSLQPRLHCWLCIGCSSRCMALCRCAPGLIPWPAGNTGGGWDAGSLLRCEIAAKPGAWPIGNTGWPRVPAPAGNTGGLCCCMAPGLAPSKSLSAANSLQGLTGPV